MERVEQLERELAAEREAREKAEGVSKQIQEQLLITDQRAEQAEAKLNIAREALSDLSHVCSCKHPPKFTADGGVVVSAALHSKTCIHTRAKEARDKIK